MYKPLAEKVRPQNLNEVFGQKHILGENKILKKWCYKYYDFLWTTGRWKNNSCKYNSK